MRQSRPASVLLPHVGRLPFSGTVRRTPIIGVRTPATCPEATRFTLRLRLVFVVLIVGIVALRRFYGLVSARHGGRQLLTPP